ncbi:hypothetical protein BJX65DRAFT_269757 [Aspergillus insuetus]
MTMMTMMTMMMMTTTTTMMMMMMMTMITMMGTTIIIEVPPADTRTRTHTTTPMAKILQTEGMAITALEDQTIAGPSSRSRPVAQQHRRLRPIARLHSRPPLHREDQGDIASSSSSGGDSA